MNGVGKVFIIKLIFKKVWRKEIVCKTLNWCLLSYGSNFDVMIFFEKMVWKKIFLINVFIDVCFSRGQNWMLRFLRKWCEKKNRVFLIKKCICSSGVKVWCQNFWERGVRKKSYQQIYLLFLGSKFDVRIFEKRMWKKNKFYQKLL